MKDLVVTIRAKVKGKRVITSLDTLAGLLDKLAKEHPRRKDIQRGRQAVECLVKDLELEVA